MDPEETIQFMREVAYDLNRAGMSDKGGFGVLIKTVGNNCLGLFVRHHLRRERRGPEPVRHPDRRKDPELG